MRYAVTFVALFLIVGTLVGIKAGQIGTLIRYGKDSKKAGPPPEVVSTAVASEDAWENTILAVGTIAAVRGVSVSNDASGVVTALHFESGQHVQAGAILLELDSSVERAQLVSAQARRELAGVNAERTKKLIDRNAVAHSQLDNDLAQLKSSSADSGQFEAQIARKTIRAPFSGWLGIRNVNLGQYLNQGTAVTTLEQLDSVYVDFTLPQQYLASCHVGQAVTVHLAGSDDKQMDQPGAISAIDPGVDPVTRTIKVRANINNKQGILRAGMFVEVSLSMGVPVKAVIAPVTTVVHASYGDSVFVVEKAPAPADGDATADAKSPGLVARQHFVKVSASRGDFVAFSAGVEPGQELVSSGAFKLRNNTRVLINNDVKLAPSLTPSVENH